MRDLSILLMEANDCKVASTEDNRDPLVPRLRSDLTVQPPHRGQYRSHV